MKHLLSIFALLSFVACDMSQKDVEPAVDLKDSSQQFSYALGNDVGRSLLKFKDEINMAVFFQGLKDTLVNDNSKLAPEVLQNIKNEYFKKIRDKELKKNSDASKKFLEDNAKKEGVITTQSGLQYLVLKEGNGDTPKSDDRVKVHYRGTLPDGKEFDSSHKRGQPAAFRVTGVIGGWTEALQLMKVGAKYKLFIPPDLAYGERGAGRDIGPNQALIFEIELLEIEEKK